ncbi:hypothetical protein FB451DRAFT_1295263 [Mycena latifolia]|nr:hypothetical protein FB451DRAFT_1295263 [Mycena latifolia]
MDLPQELIDSIVDAIVDDVDLAQDPWIIDNTVDVLETLKSCALVAHAFVRPCQAYIFHGLTLSDDERITPEALSDPFVASPHLASHVRALYFEYRAAAEHLEPITDILASMTNLARIDIYPDLEGAWQGESTGLKTLVLRSITFATTEPAESLEVPPEAPPPRVVLDSLQLYFLSAPHVQAMLDALNASSIQHVKIRAYYSDLFLAETVDVDAFAGAYGLQSLDLKVPFLPSLSKMVQLFGSFDHLVRLRTVCVTVSQKTYPTEWQELDGLLGELPALGDVNVYSGSQWTPGEPHEEALMRAWMPVLAGRDVLRIHDCAPDI